MTPHITHCTDELEILLYETGRIVRCSLDDNESETLELALAKIAESVNRFVKKNSDKQEAWQKLLKNVSVLKDKVSLEHHKKQNKDHFNEIRVLIHHISRLWREVFHSVKILQPPASSTFQSLCKELSSPKETVNVVPICASGSPVSELNDEDPNIDFDSINNDEALKILMNSSREEFTPIEKVWRLNQEDYYSGLDGICNAPMHIIETFIYNMVTLKFEQLGLFNLSSLYVEKFTVADVSKLKSKLSEHNPYNGNSSHQKAIVEIGNAVHAQEIILKGIAEEIFKESSFYFQTLDDKPAHSQEIVDKAFQFFLRKKEEIAVLINRSKNDLKASQEAISLKNKEPEALEIKNPKTIQTEAQTKSAKAPEKDVKRLLEFSQQQERHLIRIDKLLNLFLKETKHLPDPISELIHLHVAEMLMADAVDALKDN